MDSPIQAVHKRFAKPQQWSSFAGSSIDTLSERIEHALKRRKVSFDRKPLNVPSLQAFFLGGGHQGVNFQIHDGNHDCHIQLVPAFADPVTRVVFSFTSSEKKIKQMRQVCVVQIRYRGDTQSLVSELLRDVNRESEQPLWVISHHPRFQTGIFLARRVRRAWRKWV
jgi:hypothetical protein